MKRAALFLLVFQLAFLAGYNGYQLSSTLPEGGVKYVCRGDTAVLPLSLKLSPGEEIVDILWYRDKAPIAISTHGSFHALSDTHQRLTPVQEAGISLNHVTTNDTGDYSVNITGRYQNGSLFFAHRLVFLHVYDEVLGRKDNLTVRQEDGAVYDNGTGQWAVDFACGPFSFLQQPPFDVQWKTRSSGVEGSSFYKDGYFHRLLSSSEALGTVSCQLPDHIQCLSSQLTQRPAQASVKVDEVKARLATLEAKLLQGGPRQSMPSPQDVDQASEENKLLMVQNALLEEQHAQLNLQSSRLTQNIDMLSNQNAHLSSHLSLLEDRFRKMNSSFQLVQAAPHTCSQQHHCSDVNKTVNDIENMLHQEASSVQWNIQNQTAELNQANQQYLAVNQSIQDLDEKKHQLQLNNAAAKNVMEVVKNSSWLHGSGGFGNGSSPSANFCFYAYGGTQNHHTQRQLRFAPVQMPMMPVDFSGMPPMPDMLSSMNNVDPNVHHTFSQFNHHIDLSFPDGEGVDAHSHRFTVPHSGLYFFQASIRTTSTGGLLLRSDRGHLDYVTLDPEHDQEVQGACHAVVHLLRGQQVWVQVYWEYGTFYFYSQTFIGCLISRDMV